MHECVMHVCIVVIRGLFIYGFLHACCLCFEVRIELNRSVQTLDNFESHFIFDKIMFGVCSCACVRGVMRASCALLVCMRALAHVYVCMCRQNNSEQENRRRFDSGCLQTRRPCFSLHGGHGLLIHCSCRCCGARQWCNRRCYRARR